MYIEAKSLQSLRLLFESPLILRTQEYDDMIDTLHSVQSRPEWTRKSTGYSEDQTNHIFLSSPGSGIKDLVIEQAEATAALALTDVLERVYRRHQVSLKE